MLNLASGARAGLSVLSALEDVVEDESKVGGVKWRCGSLILTTNPTSNFPADDLDHPFLVTAGPGELIPDLSKLLSSFPHHQIFDNCFRELVRQERCACRERGELLDVMREHYAGLLQVS